MGTDSRWEPPSLSRMEAWGRRRFFVAWGDWCMEIECCAGCASRIAALEEFQRFFLLALKGLAIISPIGIALAGLIVAATK